MIRWLGFLWLLPMTIVVWLFYVLPVWWVLGGVRYVGKAAPLVWEFEVIVADTWYHRVWDGWSGWSGPCVIFLHESIRKRPQSGARIRLHELRHCWQWAVMGPIFPVVYFAILAAVWVPYQLRLTRRHPYFDHPLEVDARRATLL